MNKNVLEGKWNELKGRAKQKWGKLTDNDLTEIKGNIQTLAGKLQKQYGYQQNEVEKQINDFVRENDLEDFDREDKYKY